MNASMQDIDAYARSYTNRSWLVKLVKFRGDQEQFDKIQATLKDLVDDATFAIAADVQSKMSEVLRRLSGVSPYVVSVRACLM